MNTLLIVEDDKALGDAVTRLMKARLSGVAVELSESVAEGRAALARTDPAVVLTDLRLGDGSGLEVLKAAAALVNKPAVIVMTGNATLETAVEALRLGAFDYLLKPYEDEHLVHTVRRAFESKHLKERVRDLAALASEDSAGPAPAAVRADPKTKLLFEQGARLAAGTAPVLLTGESGVGKEVLARMIHAKSPRSVEAFVAINCAAIPETLLEAELFGYEKGAFTGAAAQRKGKFELADGGTLFLDEIGELPLALQPKLLRVLEGHGFLRLGGQAQITSDVRIIAATNRQIDREVSAGRFREDLFYRLNVGRLDIPPLRDRPADILPLADQFLDQLRRKYRRPDIRLSEPSRAGLLRYGWPGNVRELQNILERAVLLSAQDEIVLPDLGSSALLSREAPRLAGGLAETLESYERGLILDAMKTAEGNKTAAAKQLGLSKQLLNYKLHKYGLG
ncbi:sigma-54-dependent Fis family transcriptional regulator [bacterium]|nr:sigma-54-dependent Fis family transcriptional regulator [bacterium]